MQFWVVLLSDLQRSIHVLNIGQLVSHFQKLTTSTVLFKPL